MLSFWFLGSNHLYFFLTSIQKNISFLLQSETRYRFFRSEPYNVLPWWMFWTLTIADYYTPTIAQEIHLSSCFHQFYNSCILFIKNSSRLVCVLLCPVMEVFFTTIILLTLYCKTHSGLLQTRVDFSKVKIHL